MKFQKHFIKLFLIPSVLLIGSYGHGQASSTSLKDNMASLGKLVGDIAKGMADSSTFANSINETESIRTLLGVIVTQVPDSIAKMDPTKQPPELLIFQGLITQLEGLDIQLEGALQNADKVMIKSVLTQMLAVKDQGHALFK